MSRAYRASVAARLDRTYRASEPQKVYLKALLREAFAHRFEHGLCLDEHHLDGLTKAYASTAITTLKNAKLNCWK